jgi:arsenate reductase-like glutaredoxin family protein
MLRNDDDIKLHTYQDDLTTDDNIKDVASDELTDDPTEELVVNRNEFKAELDKLDDDKTDDENADHREDMEDIDGDEAERS